MTGVELLAYLDRRLGIEGISQDQWSTGERYDYLTEARDEVRAALSLAAPIVVQELVTLQDESSDNKWKIPDATKDPLRCICLREVTGRRNLSASSQLDQDGGLYEWLTTREIRLTDGYAPAGGLEGFFVLQKAAIDATTTEPNVGAPVPLHRLIGKYGAVLALTSDESSDATNAMGLFQRELERVERIYSEFDGQGFGAFRNAFMMAFGEQHPDSIY